MKQRMSGALRFAVCNKGLKLDCNPIPYYHGTASTEDSWLWTLLASHRDRTVLDLGLSAR